MKKAYEIAKDKKKLKKDKNNKIDFLDVIGLKIQLAIGFIIPIAFLIFVGLISYKKAEDGIVKKYEETTTSSINMARDYLDFGFDLIKSEILQLALDDEIAAYSSGMYHDNPINYNSIYKKKKKNLLAISSTNQFVESIMIIPKALSEVITSKGVVEAGFFEKWIASEEGQKINKDTNTVKSIGNHKTLDDMTNTKSDNYALSFISILPNDSAFVVIDISKEAVMQRLLRLNIGEKGIAGFITNDGKEININAEDTNSSKISEYSFIQQCVNDKEESGSHYVTYQNEKHLFIYSKSLKSEGLIYALIPMESVIKDTLSIKMVTLLLVVLACILAIFVATMILLNINKNIKNMTVVLAKASKGDLTVTINNKTKNEFGILNSRINEMIINMRNLVMKVEHSVEQVSISSNRVSNVSQDIDNSTNNIVYAIEEIDRGVSQQAEDAQQCLVQMDSLSYKMEHINKQVNEAEGSTTTVMNVLTEVIQVMHELTKQSISTTKITGKVKDDITELKDKSEVIEKFVDIIKNIEQQTNLLSLNASIEAARAGTYGGGFAVIAEEIRKLADASQEAANEIQKVVISIKLQTIETVDAANSAEVIVEKQANIVSQTIKMISQMNECIEKLIGNMNQIGCYVQDADIDRINALDSIQNISAVSQETATSSNVVTDSTGGQMEIVKTLKGAANDLNSKMNELDKELQVFKIL